MSKDLLSKIEDLRTQPVSVRNRYAFLIALTLTLVIVVLWATTLPSRLNNDVIAESDAQQREPEVGIGESFGIFANDMKEKLSEVTSQFRQADVATGTPTTTPSNVLDIEALLASSSERALLEEQLASSTPETIATTTATSSPQAL